MRPGSPYRRHRNPRAAIGLITPPPENRREGGEGVKTNGRAVDREDAEDPNAILRTKS
jgi:hypothetical protein